MEISPCHNSVAGHQIATNFCTCHGSTAVVPCAKFCSDHCIRIEMRANRNSHRIWIAMEKPLVKRAPGFDFPVLRRCLPRGVWQMSVSVCRKVPDLGFELEQCWFYRPSPTRVFQAHYGGFRSNIQWNPYTETAKVWLKSQKTDYLPGTKNCLFSVSWHPVLRDHKIQWSFIRVILYE